MLSKRQLLEAANTINFRHGGTNQGTLGEFFFHHDGTVDTGPTYMNQNLIRAALAEDGVYYKIVFGFCQSSIGRAPSGGFPLEIPATLLRLCHTPQDVLAIWDAMHGKQSERMEAINDLLESLQPAMELAA